MTYADFQVAFEAGDKAGLFAGRLLVDQTQGGRGPVPFVGRPLLLRPRRLRLPVSDGHRGQPSGVKHIPVGDGPQSARKPVSQKQVGIRYCFLMFLREARYSVILMAVDRGQNRKRSYHCEHNTWRNWLRTFHAMHENCKITTSVNEYTPYEL